MKLSEYDDEDLIEEIKHRGFIIELWDDYLNKEIVPGHECGMSIRIGGVKFEFTK